MSRRLRRFRPSETDVDFLERAHRTKLLAPALVKDLIERLGYVRHVCSLHAWDGTASTVLA